MTISEAWVAERYRLIEPLGAGGMGRVWLARDEVLRRDVAIKEIVPPEGLTQAEWEELRLRTMREARAAARLNDPHVVRIYDVVQTEMRPWIVMEYVPSRSLHQVITEDGPLPPERVAQIGLAVLAALKAAHAAGVLHRDIKPGNVLLADSGRVVLTDFGLAIFEGGDGAVTRPGMILGSPQYISPERARDGVCGPESDLWSLGATLFAAVEGRSPYARSTTYATLTALATEDPDPTHRAGVLKPVLHALLRKDPRARASMAETERLLRRAASGEGRSWPWSLPRPRRSREGHSGAVRGGPGAVMAASVSPPSVGPAAGLVVGSAPVKPRPTGPEPESVDPVSVHPAAIDATSVDSESVEQIPTAVRGRIRGSAPVPGNLRVPPPPAEIRTGPDEPPPDGRRRWLWVAAAALLSVAFVVAATYIINSTSGNSTASLRTSPSTARSAGGGAGGPVDGTPSTAPSMSASPDVRGSVGNDPVVLPDGFHYYTDPQFGWRIAVPNGWVVSRDPSYPSMVYFDEPTTPKRRLGVDRSPTPKPDPVADWTDLERRRVNGNELPGYQRVKIEAVPGYYRAAADWVYTYNGTSGSRLQVCNRGFVVNDHLAHAIFWLTPQAQWTDNASNWNLIASSFVPGS